MKQTLAHFPCLPASGLDDCLWFCLDFVRFAFRTGARYKVQIDLKLVILLPHLPECWDYRHVYHTELRVLFLVKFS